MQSADKIIIVGDWQPHSKFGASIRQQNQVVYGGGLSPAMTAEHARHEFKIMQIYEIRNE